MVHIKKAHWLGQKRQESACRSQKIWIKDQCAKRVVVIGLALGAANQHDSKLFLDTLRSVPQDLKQPAYKEMALDTAYDSQEVRTILFNFYYVPKISPNQRRSKIKPKNPIGYSRWFIEPVHAWMNKFRAIFVRYSKYVTNYLAFAQFAVAVITFNKTLV